MKPENIKLANELFGQISDMKELLDRLTEGETCIGFTLKAYGKEAIEINMPKSFQEVAKIVATNRMQMKITEMTKELEAL